MLHKKATEKDQLEKKYLEMKKKNIELEKVGSSAAVQLCFSFRKRQP
jgi:hypothetical protein